MEMSKNASDDAPAWAWKDGRLVPWDECRIHARSQAVLVGAAVFEGIRGYWNDADGEVYLFRLADHFRRMAESMKIMRMEGDLPDLEAACIELVVANGWRENVHLAPFAYMDVAPDFGFISANANHGFFITAIARPRSQAVENGVHVRVSSFVRLTDHQMPPRVKASANYQNSRLAMAEARVDGYQNAILLTPGGVVAEAADACVVLLRRGRLVTPPVTSGILESVTRATILQLAAEAGIAIEEREVDRSELYVADEVFLCGTGAEITPVLSVDRIGIGARAPGAITRRLQKRYLELAAGTTSEFPEWRTPVYRRSLAPAT
jgi:branched-chain amino acid aminotransferase